MIPPFRFFELYQAIQLHFKSDSYDFFKYDGKTRCTESSFLGRRDKYFFEKFAKICANEQYAQEFIVANFIAGKTYIRNFEVGIYEKWDAERRSMFYKFEEYVDEFIRQKNVVNMFYSGAVPKEFLIIFNTVLGGNLFKKEEDNILFDDIKSQINAYKPFLFRYWNINKDTVDRLREVTREKLNTAA